MDTGTEAMAMQDEIEALIANWHDIAVPNDVARYLVADLAKQLAALAQVRGSLRFEDEPASFEAALREASR